MTSPSWKQLKHPLMGEYIDKWWCFHTMEFYSRAKVNELLIRLTWVNFKIVMLSEQSQTKEEYITFTQILELAN